MPAVKRNLMSAGAAVWRCLFASGDYFSYYPDYAKSSSFFFPGNLKRAKHISSGVKISQNTKYDGIKEQNKKSGLMTPHLFDK